MKKRLITVRRRRPKLSPTLRLTLSYLGILMIVSLFLTIALYRVSAGEADRGLKRERLYFEGANPYAIDPSYQQIETGQANGLHTRLREQLIGLNIIILALGGGLSYYLARRTLSPIERALAAQTRFAADASHELRTPLTAMKSEIEVALRDAKLPIGDARELLGSNLEEVAKLEALSSGLLRLARHENEPLELSLVAVIDIIELAIKRVQTAASERGIKLNVGATQGSVMGDLDSLVELLVTLLDNAIKYSSADGEVEIASTVRGGTVTVVIRDFGAGISATDLPHIFERFYRADTSRSKTTPGYGLGLSIAARIAELHSGSIDATSRFGQGSTFTIHLPLASS